MRKRKADPGRVGSKRHDMRWRDSAGDVWASKHELDVYTVLTAAGATARRCSAERDAVAYTTNIRGGYCVGCGAKKVAQAHQYTPDLYIAASVSSIAPAGCYIEAKGYLRASDRRVLRGVMAAKPDFSLRLVLQRYHAETVEWAHKFLKIPVLVLTKKDGLLEAA